MVGAAVKVPECRSDVSAPRSYLCWEMRCALTFVVRCSTSGDKAAVVLVWRDNKRRSLGASASCS